jgi:hypothetical protein
MCRISFMKYYGIPLIYIRCHPFLELFERKSEEIPGVIDHEENRYNNTMREGMTPTGFSFAHEFPSLVDKKIPAMHKSSIMPDYNRDFG